MNLILNVYINTCKQFTEQHLVHSSFLNPDKIYNHCNTCDYSSLMLVHTHLFTSASYNFMIYNYVLQLINNILSMSTELVVLPLGRYSHITVSICSIYMFAYNLLHSCAASIIFAKTIMFCMYASGNITISNKINIPSNYFLPNIRHFTDNTICY